MAIRFYRVGDPYGGFSNFSPHSIRLGGKTWKTTEQDFQAMKFEGHPDEEEVRRAGSPMIAKRMGGSRKRPLRRDWGRVRLDVMRAALRAKFTQHEELRRELLSTLDEELIEHTERDAFWGDGGDGSGRNMLGRLLMELRAALRAEGGDTSEKPD